MESRGSRSEPKLTIQLETPIFPPIKYVEDYVEKYARLNDLLPHIQFSTEVLLIERDEAAGKWTVHTRTAAGGNREHSFDRVLVANGMLKEPNMPKIKGLEKFAGSAIHSREFKDVAKYEGKRVLVVGIGPTGSDSASFLKEHKAAKIWISHRGQPLLVLPSSRITDGGNIVQTLT